MKNTTSSIDGSRPRGLAVALPLLAVALVAAGCSRSSSTPPVVTPEPVVIEPQDTVQELSDRADVEYWLGVEAQNAGDEAAAQRHFDAAVEVFMDADVPVGHEADFRLAFNDLMSRVHSQQLEDFQVSPEDEATHLPQDEIPALSAEEIDLLRARMADTLPAMPRFSIPVPTDNPRVLEALKYLTTQRTEVIQEGLSRATRYQPLIIEVFDEEGVPRELAWIPLIESLFKPWVRSRASAVGLWQLMAPTARLYGLRVDWFVDERRDPVKSTRAIARFIKDYYNEFDDWHLAIAAYNGGKGRVSRAMRRAGVSDFWSLTTSSRYLPRETREFVPKILAAILIGSDPLQYELTFDQQPLYVYDEVTLDSMTDLEVAAEAAGTTLEVIQELNPHLLRRTTPNVSEFTLRVPQGHGRDFMVAYAAIPVDERVRIAEHVVRRGETLSHIGDQYGLSWRAVADYNGITNPRRVRAGTRLLIPIGGAPTARAPRTVSADLVQGSGHGVGDKITHAVRRGESLWSIANAYGTSVADVKRWNGLRSDRINPGDRLDVYYRSSGPAAASSVAAAPARAGSSSSPGATTQVSYTIRRGDTLTGIARQHNVSVADVRAWNNLRSDRIYPGNRLTIYTDGSTVATTYTVRRGDTLSAIARRFGVSVNDLVAWNGISSRTTLYPGNRLLIRDAAGR